MVIFAMLALKYLEHSNTNALQSVAKIKNYFSKAELSLINQLNSF